MRLTRRNFLKMAGFAGAGLILGAEVSPPMRVLRILVPHRSLGTLPLREFEHEMNVKIVETLRATSLQNNDLFSKADLAIVPSYTLTHLIRNTLVRELPPATSHQQLSTSHQQPATNYQRPYDPYDSFSVLAAHGIIGINARNVAPPQTWEEFFALAKTVPTYLPPVESLNAAIKSLGDSINTRNTYIHQQAQSLIFNLQSFPLQQSQLAIAPPLKGWNFVVPREGVELWEDNFCIPATSTQPELAQQFIEFIAGRKKIEKVEGEMLSAFSLTVLTL